MVGVVSPLASKTEFAISSLPNFHVGVHGSLKCLVADVVTS